MGVATVRGKMLFSTAYNYTDNHNSIGFIIYSRPMLNSIMLGHRI